MHLLTKAYMQNCNQRKGKAKELGDVISGTIAYLTVSVCYGNQRVLCIPKILVFTSTLFTLKMSDSRVM